MTDGGERLQNVIARAGVASRRGAAALVEAGRVTVDGVVVTEPGRRVDPDKAAVVASPAVGDAVAVEELRLGATGRVLLRPSGTEQLVRVVVEAEDADLAGEVAERLAGVVAANQTLDVGGFGLCGIPEAFVLILVFFSKFSLCCLVAGQI